MLDADIIVVGAGPVGMVAALLAASQGLEVLLLEKSGRRHTQPRAIGITPPSLEILQPIGLAASLINNGVEVRFARIHDDKKLLCSIDFGELQGSFPYVLAIPQHRTEALLEEALAHMPSVRLLRGHAVQDVSVQGDVVTIYGRHSEEGRFCFGCHCLLGCDGAKSVTRSALGIPFWGAADPQRFLMADFESDGAYGDDACFFFTPRGSVESFPLPGRQRRYVVRAPSSIPTSAGDYLRTELLARAGIAVGDGAPVWESSFGVQRYVAATLAKDRVFLCGDAAHLMSPVGGQNMNTGFADAELACWLARLVIERAVSFGSASFLYNRVRMLAARSALQRAHRMMLAGTSGGHVWSAVRATALAAVFRTPLRGHLLRQFSMQSIPFCNLDHYKTVFEAELGI